VVPIADIDLIARYTGVKGLKRSSVEADARTTTLNAPTTAIIICFVGRDGIACEAEAE